MLPLLDNRWSIFNLFRWPTQGQYNATELSRAISAKLRARSSSTAYTTPE
jgi:hypothetical protein